MQKLVQIIYISRSTFENTIALNKIEPNVMRILAKSRINNRKNGLVGVLYFGDGAFFQCLEGDEEAINTLLAKLEKDTRHTDIKLISRKYVSRLSFPDWAMKYAFFDEKIGKYLKENGFQRFDPYSFTPEMTLNILGLLIDTNDPVSELPTTDSTNAQDSISTKSQTKNSHKNLLIISLLISVLALVIAITALLSVRGMI